MKTYKDCIHYEVIKEVFVVFGKDTFLTRKEAKKKLGGLK